MPSLFLRSSFALPPLFLRSSSVPKSVQSRCKVGEEPIYNKSLTEFGLEEQGVHNELSTSHQYPNKYTTTE